MIHPERTENKWNHKLRQKPDGSFNGALGDTINKEADFIVNGKDYLTDLFEFTSSIYDDKLCIVTKTSELVCSESINILSGIEATILRQGERKKEMIKM